MTSDNLGGLGAAAIAELADILGRLPDDAGDELMDAIARSRRIALYGAGREGLAIKGFAMRLYHMGLDAHVVGDMTVPPLERGDLLIVTSGHGELATGDTLMRIADEAGAETAIITAQPDGATARRAHIRLVLPAQTMADDLTATPSVLPMGSAFEIAETVFLELIILMLRERLGETAETMRARHTNLE